MFAFPLLNTQANIVHISTRIRYKYLQKKTLNTEKKPL